MAKFTPPLNQTSPIVDGQGRPTTDFLLLVNQLLKSQVQDAGVVAQNAFTLATTALSEADALRLVDIIAGVGLSGGGLLGAGDVTINLEDTAVVPGTYGDDTHSAQITVDQQGRITTATEIPIAGGGGGGFTVVFDQTLSVAAALVNIPTIPQGFTDLRLIVEAGRTAGGSDYCAVLLNSDSTAGHYASYVENRFGTASYNNIMRWGSMESAGPDYAISDGWIFGYSDTTRHKHSTSQGSFISSGFMDRNAAVWFSNAAVTSMDVIAGSSTFTAGTRIRLLAV